MVPPLPPAPDQRENEELILPHVRIPFHLDLHKEAHSKWLRIVKDAELIVMEDVDLQRKAASGLRLKERRLPPEVLGRLYAQYCDLVNKMYAAYLSSVQLQRAEYIVDILGIFMKRLFELRNELIHVVLSDYVYVDMALVQLRMTPYDIQVVIPYHYPLEARPDSVEELLRTMHAESVKRVIRREKYLAAKAAQSALEVKSKRFSKSKSRQSAVMDFSEVFPEDDEEEVVEKDSEHTIIPENYVHTVMIQKNERFRQFYQIEFRAKCTKWRTYFAAKVDPAPLCVREKAAAFIQYMYRIYMGVKRERVRQNRRDMLLGLVPDVDKRPRKYEEENNKLYEKRRKTRNKIRVKYLEELEREDIRLVRVKKDDTIEDITNEIREWFYEWYREYGFFPQYPYEAEGGTVLVIRGQFPTPEEQLLEDERIRNLTKGKTKEMLKQEKVQAAFEAKMKAELAEEQRKKEKVALFKARCNPSSDPGYQPRPSDYSHRLIEVMQRYRQAWSIYDEFPTDASSADLIYGFVQPVLTEDLMSAMHVDCRRHVDELMRLELKLYIAAQKAMFKRVDWKYPRLKPRRKPKVSAIPKPFNVDEKLLKSLEKVFDMNIMSRPATKIKDVCGDLNYAAYDLNIQDPEAKFPSPGYGDVRRRLALSGVLGSGIEPCAKRNKSIMLIGPERNGKSFLVDAVAGELNAIKLDISPEVFSARLRRPAKVLSLVFLAARVFQPSVIYLRNIERVFCKKVPPEERHLNAKSIKTALGKLLKTMIPPADTIIFIATCSNPAAAAMRPMFAMFSEVILVPTPDYGSIQMFLYEKLQSIRSIPRDYNVHGLAKILQGIGFGTVIEMFNAVMTPERIVRLNCRPLQQSEFLEYLIEMEIVPMSQDEYQNLLDVYIRYSPLNAAREEYKVINANRDYVYKKMAKKAAEDEAKKAAAKAK